MHAPMTKNAARVAACALALLLSTRATAAEYKVLVPQLSPATTELYKKLAAAILQAGGASASIEVVPFARGIHQLEVKEADLLLLVIENPDPAKVAASSVDYSTETLFPLAFVLYSNSSKRVDPDDLKRGNPQHLVVGTDLAHVGYFPFQAEGSTSIEAGLSKLAAGRIDAFVFAQPSTDAELKRLQFKNVNRQFYALYNTRIILRKGARGGALDQLITAGLAKMKRDGSFQQLMGKYLETASRYVEWQP